MGRKGELKGELPGATALKTDKKEERRVGKPKPLHPSLRDRASFCGNPARKFKVALRRKAMGIEDVLILLFKEHLQSIGSLLHTYPYSSIGDTHSHPRMHIQW